MDWSDLKSVIGKAAPIIGTALGGPAGALVGTLVSSALGTDNTPLAVQAALQANPDAFLKLQQLEVSHTEFLANILAQNNQSQLAVDLVAEQSASVFQKWRDGLGWIGVVGLGYAFLIQPLFSWGAALWAPLLKAPVLDNSSLMALVITLLGATAAHVTENIKDAYHV